ncbi:MAG: radical SAM protein [Firmicutes bacterium]|nr:radical SAM protein [Bacillota bacterium]
MKKNLTDHSLTELKETCTSLNEPTYRAKQLFKWLSLGKSFDEMTDIPKSFRDKLKEEYNDIPLKIIKTLTSKDGTQKFLYEFHKQSAVKCHEDWLDDTVETDALVRPLSNSQKSGQDPCPHAMERGDTVEGVLMKQSYGNTLCVSTQVGCAMRCSFCASGYHGLVRNLTVGEIYGQVVVANNIAKISNIVLMGSGEPLDNYDNTLKAISLMTDENGLNISKRSISLSTCGLPDKIKQLADDDAGVILSISLHATTDEIRQELMPIAKKHTLKELLDATKYYFEKSGRRVVFEYLLIKDINTNHFDTLRIQKIAKSLPCHFNLIMLNSTHNKSLKGLNTREGERFLEKLKSLSVSATIRKSAGSDIEGACGQLRGKFVGQNNKRRIE